MIFKYMARKAFVDRNTCIGCSVCNHEAPSVFIDIRQDPEHNGDFKSFVDENSDHEAVADKVDEAIAKCPVQCISWKGTKAAERTQ